MLPENLKLPSCLAAVAVFGLSAIVPAVAVLALAGNLRAQAPPSQDLAKPFYLHEGDTVVFYGDSITEQRFYTFWVEVYAETRFPRMHLNFYNAGVGGDRVSGGAGGPIDVRLSRDVFPLRPTVVTIMLGMNDGGYRPLTPEIESAYTKGYEHILDSIEKSLPGARVTLLGPSPYDEVTRPQSFPGGYNATLMRFSALDAEMAQRHKDTFIDLNAPFVDSLRKGVAINPLATELLLPDRVHPEQLAHWFMAAAILKGWNAPALVSAATIDAASHTVVEQRNTSISNLTADGSRLSWTALDGALPLPIEDSHAGIHFLRELLPLDEELNQQPLRISGLQAGDYVLTIDGTKAGQFSSEELGRGINLAKLNTPMRGQAYSVCWQIRDRDDAHYVRLKALEEQMESGTPREKLPAELLEFEGAQQKHIYDTAQPKPHGFVLTAIANAP
jgi:lysophospholipase L1-like esterase